MLLVEFVQYWLHRWMHNNVWLWPMCDIQGLENSPAITAKTDPCWTANDRSVGQSEQAAFGINTAQADVRSIYNPET